MSSARLLRLKVVSGSVEASELRAIPIRGNSGTHSSTQS